MQNRYVGDLGDFGKYGLLRSLCPPGESTLRLGVVWYLVPDQDHNADGKHVRYLEPTQYNLASFRCCDPELYDALRDIVTVYGRHVARVRESRVLPSNTVFYDAPLIFDRAPASREARKMRSSQREQWLEDALGATRACDVVFVDPDNGLEAGTLPLARHGPKYAYYRDLTGFIFRGQTVVVYHHIGRRGTAREQIHGRLQQLAKRFPHTATPWALLYHRGSARAFFVLPSTAHAVQLRQLTSTFLSGPWGNHFELFHASTELPNAWV